MDNNCFVKFISCTKCVPSKVISVIFNKADIYLNWNLSILKVF